MGRRRRSLRSRAKGTGYATARSPSKAQPLLNPALLELDVSQRHTGPRTAPVSIGEPLEYPTKNPATQPLVVWIYESGASRPT